MTAYIEAWRERYTIDLARVGVWRERHRLCQDTPPPIEDLAEAQAVLSEHAGHGGGCLQYAAAMRRTSVEVA